MSKERELIEALRESISDTSASAESLRQATGGVPAGGGGAAAVAQPGPTNDVDRLWNLITETAASMTGDPIFYLKVVAIIVLTIVILSLSYHLIAGS